MADINASRYRHLSRPWLQLDSFTSGSNTRSQGLSVYHRGIAGSAGALRVLDGEGVICGRDGKSEFDRMRACFSRNGAPEAFLYAFDVLELDGRDLRKARGRLVVRH